MNGFGRPDRLTSTPGQLAAGRRILLIACALIATSTGTAVAQPSRQSAGIDLSQFGVPPQAIGDGWSVTSQNDEPTLFRTGFSPPAVAGYAVNYAQSRQVTASIALYEFPDHVGAVAAALDLNYYWGHGNTSLVPLSGLGDDQSFRAYPVGKGPNSGITFVDGPIVAYVRAEDDGASDTTGVDATCDSLAAAADGLLQATGTPSAAQFAAR
jgi:hypothetical protein